MSSERITKIILMWKNSEQVMWNNLKKLINKEFIISFGNVYIKIEAT